MNKPQISVIVPIYNVEPYLAECLESIKNQSYTNLEVIMINDGSTDLSRDIAQKYVDADSRFCLIEQNNRGLSAARNKGLQYAGGKYIIFLDSDDYLVYNTLEKLYIFSEENELDVVKYSASIFDDELRQLEWTSEPGGYRYKGEYLGVTTGVNLLNEIYNNNDYFPSCCMLFIKREIIVDNNLSFYEGIIHEDNLFHLQLLVVSRRVGVYNYPFYCRRYRRGSITMSKDSYKKIYSMRISGENADVFMAEHGVPYDIREKYVFIFIYSVMECWLDMNKFDRGSKGVKQECEKICKLARKYNYSRKFYVWLFSSSKKLYLLEYWLKGKVKRMLKKWHYVI